MIPLAKLRWQCRRGTKELDFLLLRYVDLEYALADTQEKALFMQLLALEDDQLIDLLLGDLVMETAEMKALIKKVRV
ncbi:MAG: succinate dehydrogenase assembly factor 2 [Methylococcales bacterium]|jgi:antitoxin CptB|nr:succinate dehydrogenase assembly factor 2 [uncultured bacterium]MCX7107788.1 succinate dehydrogenase assembly factor 2 [Methylococcales bacterium]